MQVAVPYIRHLIEDEYPEFITLNIYRERDWLVLGIDGSNKYPLFSNNAHRYCILFLRF